MPEQLYSLTLFELNSLSFHHLRQIREGHYNAYLMAWMQNHKEGDVPAKAEAILPLPGEPGWKPNQPEKGSTLEEHIAFMKAMGLGGPDNSETKSTE